MMTYQEGTAYVQYRLLRCIITGPSEAPTLTHRGRCLVSTTAPMSEQGKQTCRGFSPRQARCVQLKGAGVCEKTVSSSVGVEKAYQDLFRFCWKIGGVHSFEDAMIQWDLQKKVTLSPTLQTALERRCKWLGLPQA